MEAAAAHIDALLSVLQQKEQFSGSALIATKGQTLLSQGYGYANREHEVRNTAQTKFRVGSITKPFTAMAILMLQERGLLSVQDPLARFVPFGRYADSLTIHQLLTHTSGVPNITKLPNFHAMMRQPAALEQTSRLVLDLALDYEPGSEFRYSNSGYILLAYVIERATGLSYNEFLRMNLFDLLGMTSTGCDSHQAIIPHRAQGYEYDQGIINAAYIDMSLPTGGGNLYSTAEDLYKWDQALYSINLVKKETLDAIITDYGAGYGYGWFVHQQDGRKQVYHGGGINGFKNKIIRAVDDQLTIILLNNLSTADIDSIASDIQELIAVYASREAG